MLPISTCNNLVAINFSIFALMLCENIMTTWNQITRPLKYGSVYFNEYNNINVFDIILIRCDVHFFIVIFWNHSVYWFILSSIQMTIIH